MKRLDRKRLTLLLCMGILIILFWSLSHAIASGATDRWDTELLQLCRDGSPEMKPRGSPKFVSIVRDVTALGSATVLTMLVIIVTLYYLLQQRWRTGLFLLVTSLVGWGLMESVKEIYARPRPTVVPHLMDENSYSFPSGHAKMSAVIYLTLGALLARNSAHRSVKVFWVSVAVFLTLLIGCSRVFMGVHHPSDVLAGWVLGLLWVQVALLLREGMRLME